jgi:predicted GNAT family N-acyltransferase
VREARTREEVEAAMGLRQRVFRGEGALRLPQRGGIGGSIIHVVAFRAEGGLVGTCRLLISSRLARLAWLAVEPEQRGRGTGAAIVDAAERAARGAGARRMRLHARLAALSLYRRAGYEPRGETFEMEGIEHLTMEKDLA